MDNIIYETENLLKKQINEQQIREYGIPFDYCQKSYFWSNENIKGYMEKVDISANSTSKALSVAGSGDQVFNLIGQGILDIDTFDTNLLADYFAFGIKRALILRYSYQEFMEIVVKLTDPRTSLTELTEIIKDLLPYMEKKYHYFWNYIIDYNYQEQKSSESPLNLFQMLNIRLIFTPTNNNYLSNEVEYNKLKQNLEKARINFKYCHIIDIPYEFKRKYDYMLFSNILDYMNICWNYGWDYSRLQNFLKELVNIANPDCLIFLHYIFNYKTKTKEKRFIFQGSKLEKNDLTDEIIYDFKGANNSAIQDGMVLKRIS